MRKLKADNNEISLTLSSDEKAKVAEIVSEEGSAAQGGNGPIKSLAFFLGLLITFTTVLLPIIDKIFPDAPPVAVTPIVENIATTEKAAIIEKKAVVEESANVKKSPGVQLPPMSQEEFLRIRREASQNANK
jgi:hypothetical protein